MRTLLVSLLLVVSAAAATPPRVLFIRGGAGTGGFLEGGSDDQLADIHDGSTAPGNHGFGQLKTLLEAGGFDVEQVVEGAGPAGTAVDLLALDLAPYDVIVFGSNNAVYSAAAAAKVADHVCAGGGVLFISDANWGSDWGDAPSSDQTFLDGFDLVMNQDTGTYALERAAGDFVVGGVDHGAHPVLAGPDGFVGNGDDVNAFDGEGVSPATVSHLLPGIEPIVLAKAKGLVHRNDAPGGGSFSPATVDDGALVVATHGAGRIACHFDRNTFFNQNGAGTSLFKHDNAQLALNLFAWLAGKHGPTYGEGCPGTGAIVPAISLLGCSQAGQLVTLDVHGGLGGAPVLLLFGAGAAYLPLMGACNLLVGPPPLAILTATLSGPAGAPGQGSLGLSAVLPPLLPASQLAVQAAIADPGAVAGLCGTAGLLIPLLP